MSKSQRRGSLSLDAAAACARVGSRCFFRWLRARDVARRAGHTARQIWPTAATWRTGARRQTWRPRSSFRVAGRQRLEQRRVERTPLRTPARLRGRRASRRGSERRWSLCSTAPITRRARAGRARVAPRGSGGSAAAPVTWPALTRRRRHLGRRRARRGLLDARRRARAARTRSCALPERVAAALAARGAAGGAAPRTVRVGARRLGARAPDRDDAEPYARGWLAVLEASYLGTTPYGPWLVSLARERTLPSWLADGAWDAGWATVVPTNAWVNYEARARPLTSASLAASAAFNATAARDFVAGLNTSSVVYLLLTCPLPDACTTASTTSIGAGARLFLSGVPEALSAGEFYYDVDATTLIVHDRDGDDAAAQGRPDAHRRGRARRRACRRNGRARAVRGLRPPRHVRGPELQRRRLRDVWLQQRMGPAAERRRAALGRGAACLGRLGRARHGLRFLAARRRRRARVERHALA